MSLGKGIVYAKTRILLYLSSGVLRYNKNSMNKKTTIQIDGSEEPGADTSPLSDVSETDSVASHTAEPEISPEEIESLPVFEQYLAVWGTAARGRELWQTWYERLSENGKEVLDHLAEASAEERGISPEDARRRMAVEKFLMDRGGDEYAAEQLHQWRKRKRDAQKPLQPMVINRKRKR